MSLFKAWAQRAATKEVAAVSTGSNLVSASPRTNASSRSMIGGVARASENPGVVGCCEGLDDGVVADTGMRSIRVLAVGCKWYRLENVI